MASSHTLRNTLRKNLCLVPRALLGFAQFVTALVLLHACVSAKQIAAPGDPHGLKNFQRFPPVFKALQVIEVTYQGKQDTLIANVVRNEKVFSVTLLHPLWMQPLVQLDYDGTTTRTQAFVDLALLPFQPDRILDAARALYQAEHFESALSVLILRTPDFEYELTEFKAFEGHCFFPAMIRLTPPRVPNEAQSKVALNIATRELECAKK